MVLLQCGVSLRCCVQGGVVKMPEKDLEADYEIGAVLGTGGFGTVYAGTRRRDAKPVHIGTPIGTSPIGPVVRYQACFCAESCISSWENQQKLLTPELHFFP